MCVTYLYLDLTNLLKAMPVSSEDLELPVCRCKRLYVPYSYWEGGRGGEGGEGGREGGRKRGEGGREGGREEEREGGRKRGREEGREREGRDSNLQVGGVACKGVTSGRCDNNYTTS